MRTLALIRYLHEVLLRKHYEQTKNKGQAFGYAGLDENGNLPISELPNVNDQVLLGRGDTGPGPVVEVTIGGGLIFTGNVLDAAGGGGGGVPDGDKGDVIVSGGGLVWTIDADVVTDPKLANMADSTLKGRGQGGGSGDPEAITLGANLSMTGTVLSATSGGGGGAPTGAEYLVGASDAGLSAERVVTDTPTVAWDLATAGQAKAAVPNDAITTAKILADNVTDAKLANMNASTLKGRGSAGGAGDPQEITLGSNLSMTGTVLSATSGGGGMSAAEVAGRVAMRS